MKKLLLGLALLLSSLSVLAAGAVSGNAAVSSTKSSILQTQIEPYLEAEDTSQQLHSTIEVLVITQTELESTQEVLSATDSLLESTQEVLSETDSLLESTQEVLSATDSLLESTQDLLSDTDSLLESTQDLLSNTDSLLESTQEVLSETESLLESTQDLLSDTDSLLESTQDVLSATDSLLETTQEQLSASDGIIESAQDLMFDPSVPAASSIDDIASRLGLVAPYDGVNVTDPLLDQINDGLIPYLQAALTKLGELSPIKQIAAGNMHTVVLLKNGTVYATGSNTSGQLGNDSLVDTNVLTLMTTNNSNIIAIAAGGNFTIVLKSSGTVYATGQNTSGQLGDSTTDEKHILTEMTDNNSNIIAIAAGGAHTVALKSDGTVYGTGRNDYGQLGDDTINEKHILTAMTTNNSNISAISAGAFHTLALKSDGTAYGTGSNDYGALGDGTNGEKHILTAMTTNNSNIIAIAGGGFHSLALKSTGTVYATGSNTSGQLGDGTNDDKNVLTAMTTNNSNISAISAGSSHSHALKSDGTVYGTGRNNRGQLGDDTTGDKNILTVMTTDNSGILAIAAGSEHTSVLKSDGTAYGTGRNDYGQLGDGTTGDKDVLTEMAPFLS
jgi:alpha-tubulin suppressor-like RCC1 family protein/ElaB/YqjD/DUF883 family membrane-anchored ribosome-binding protein